MPRGLTLSLIQRSSASPSRSYSLQFSEYQPRSKTALGRGSVKPQGLPLMATPHLSPASRLTGGARMGLAQDSWVMHLSYGTPCLWERGTLHLTTGLLRKDVGAVKHLSSICRDKSVLFGSITYPLLSLCSTNTRTYLVLVEPTCLTLFLSLRFPLLPRSMPSSTSGGLSFSAVPKAVNVGTRASVGYRFYIMAAMTQNQKPRAGAWERQTVVFRETTKPRTMCPNTVTHSC